MSIEIDHKMSDILIYEWSCPSCTYSNKPASFKCHVCGTPKGTATRQTKYHSSTMEQQHMAETMSQHLLRLQASRAANRFQSTNSSNSIIVESSSGGSSTSNSPNLSFNKTHLSSTASASAGKRRLSRSHKSSTGVTRQDRHLWPKLTNINRSSGRSCQVTVDSLTVIITEYDFLYPDSD